MSPALGTVPNTGWQKGQSLRNQTEAAVSFGEEWDEVGTGNVIMEESRIRSSQEEKQHGRGPGQAAA